MRIQLSDHFNYKRLLRFTISPILMMICTSLYSIVDGFFVSNYVGKTPFAAVNLIMPVCMVTAEKPGLSLKLSIIAGVTNVILDFLFIVVFHWGLAGAAIATGVGQVVGGVVPVIYFVRRNDSLLQLTKTRVNGKILCKTFTNGSSEMITNLSASLVNILYNFQLMKIAGENGVAAYGIIMYVTFIFMAIYFGYSIGCAPIIGYHYGASNYKELKNLFQKSVLLMGGSGIILTSLAEILTSPLVTIFASYDKTLYDMTCYGFRLYSLAFIVMGINVWGSSFFTALGNGAISATISFFRTLVFQVAVVLILPIFLGIDGIWLAIVIAELLALCITIVFFITKRKKYQYA